MPDNDPAAQPVRVFLCHSHKDKEVVETVSRRLQSIGLLTWLDNIDLDIGDDLVSAITEGIDSSTFIAVFLSKDALKSKWVKNEMRIAFGKTLDAKKKFLPIMLDEIEEEELPGYIRGLLYADLRVPSPAAITHVTALMKRAISNFDQSSPRANDIPLTASQRYILITMKLMGDAGKELSTEAVASTTKIAPHIVEETLQELTALGLLSQEYDPELQKEEEKSYQKDHFRSALLPALDVAQQIDDPEQDIFEVAAQLLGVDVESVDDQVNEMVEAGILTLALSTSHFKVARALRGLDDLSDKAAAIVFATAATNLPKDDVARIIEELEGLQKTVKNQKTEEMLDALVKAGVLRKTIEGSADPSFQFTTSEPEEIARLAAEGDAEQEARLLDLLRIVDDLKSAEGGLSEEVRENAFKQLLACVDEQPDHSQ